MCFGFFETSIYPHLYLISLFKKKPHDFNITELYSRIAHLFCSIIESTLFYRHNKKLVEKIVSLWYYFFVVWISDENWQLKVSNVHRAQEWNEKHSTECNLFCYEGKSRCNWNTRASICHLPNIRVNSFDIYCWFKMLPIDQSFVLHVRSVNVSLSGWVKGETRPKNTNRVFISDCLNDFYSSVFFEFPTILRHHEIYWYFPTFPFNDTIFEWFRYTKIPLDFQISEQIWPMVCSKEFIMDLKSIQMIWISFWSDHGAMD